MHFLQICVIGVTSLTESTKETLRTYSKGPVQFFEKFPPDEDQMIEAIADTDCLLVGVRARITKRILEKCSSLKYIGVTGTHPTYIDLKQAAENGVSVTTVDGYCDHETAEFVLTELLKFARGLAGRQWKARPRTLQGKSIGIVGLGRVGWELAEMCNALGMKVCYYSRSRKPDAERKEIEYRSLPALMESCDVISLHTPAYEKVLGQEEIMRTKKGSILINTCLGQPVDESALRQWLEEKENKLIMDAAANMFYRNLEGTRNVIVSPCFAYDTEESRQSLNRMILDNIDRYLALNG